MDFPCKHRLRALGKRAPKKKFRPVREEAIEAGENCIMRSFLICTPTQILLGL
jgi:hypothetical protein